MTSISENSLNGNSQNTPLLTNCDYALEMVKRGFLIFPVRPDDETEERNGKRVEKTAKSPIWTEYFTNGHKTPTGAKTIVEDAWRERPDALIGLSPGERGLICIDIDNKLAQADGWTTVQAIKRMTGGVEPVAVVQTQRAGGHHVFYRWRGQHGNKQWELVDYDGAIMGDGEIRCTNGYIALHDPAEFIRQYDLKYKQAEYLPPDFVKRLVEKKPPDEIIINTPPDDPAVVKSTAENINEWIDDLPLDDEDDTASRPLQTVCLSDVRPEKHEWLLDQWLLKGAVTLLAGAPATGKTAIVMSVLAHLATGRNLFGRRANNFRRALYWTAEDSLARTIKPRLLAAGASNADVERLVAIKDDDFTDNPAANLSRLVDYVMLEGDIDLIVFDPIIRLLGDRNSNSATEVRAGLQPLLDLAEMTGAAVIGVHHLVKGTTIGANSVSGLDRVLGSGAWGQVARQVWITKPDPRNDDDNGDDMEREYQLLRAKSNIGDTRQAFKYQLAGVVLDCFDDPNAPPYEVVAVKWGEAFANTGDAFIVTADPQACIARGLITEYATATATATGDDWIRTAGAETDLKENDGVSHTTFYRALNQLCQTGRAERKRGQFRIKPA